MNQKWWQDAIVYQIYPRSFYDTDGDGIGDIPGIIQKLDYIKALGCNVIWLCPIYQSPMKDNGYDIADYYKIDPRFGTNEDVYRLIDEAKKRNIKIIMDLVINHCSSEHEWFKAALKDPLGPYGKYFIIKEGKDGAPPNNWRSIFGGSVWEKIPGTDLYYFHTFAKEQPDLNWETKELREELYKMVNWWLDKGLGGFRVDAITYIKKDHAFPSAPANGPDGLTNANPYSQNYPGIGTFLSELRDRCFKPHNCMTVAEAPGVPADELVNYIGENGYFSMIFDFSYADIDVIPGGDWHQRRLFTAKEFRDTVFETQLNLQKAGWGANYLENHDQPRSLNKYLPEGGINYHSATMLGTFYFFLRGTPYIYQGEELGMVNANWESIDHLDDIQTKDQYRRALAAGLTAEEAMSMVNRRSRDNSRTPFPWTGGLNAGFTEGTPWLPLAGGHLAVNAETEGNDPKSVLSYYKKMIALRKDAKWRDALILGDFKPCLTEYDTIAAYLREYNRQQILILCNFSEKETLVKTDFTADEILLSNYNELQMEANGIRLKPWQAVVFSVE